MARRRSRFVRPPKSTKVWMSVGLGPTMVATGTSPVLMGVYNALALALRPFTILRTRALLAIASDQVVASESNSGAFSMQIITDSASAAGIASIPTPLTQPEADYFVYMPWQFDFAFFTGVGVEAQFAREQVIDSKSMRKVGLDDDIAVVVQGLGADGYTVVLEGRQLIQLH